MPKNKKPAGGRPARDFDPRYGAKKSGKPGSRSEGHRGYRPTDDADAGKKRRWTPDERAARGVAPARPRGGDRGESASPARDRSDDRGARQDHRQGGFRGDRDETRSYRDDRPYRGRDDRQQRDDRGQRSTRTGSRDERAPRAYDGDRRRQYDERPARRFDTPTSSVRREDRSRRDFDGERPRRQYGDDRPRRDFDGDRPRRSFDTSAGSARRDDRPRRDGDRPARGAGDDRQRRQYDTSASSARGEDRPRRQYSDDRPRRQYSEDRPRRQFDTSSSARHDDRPRRRYDDDRPRRSDASASTRHDDRRTDAPRERRESSFYPKRDDRTPNAGGHSAGHASNDDVVLERLEAEAIQASDVDGVSFGELGLGGNVVRTLAELGAASPFPIQAATIPDVLAGRDVLGRGRTGSGKTIAFGAPLVERLMRAGAESGGPVDLRSDASAEQAMPDRRDRYVRAKRTMGRAPRALIMAPTRELALQIDRTVQPIARSVGLFTTQIYGGVPQARQVGALRRGVDIVIGTPGRIEDLIEQGHLDLGEVAITVLDEADHMCDLGFLEPVQRILRQTAAGGQKLLFSATLDSGVANLVKEFLVAPAVHEVAGEDQASGTIDHRVFVIEHREKGAIVEQLADRDGKTLVFARTRAFAEQLADQLDDAGIPAVSLHGDLSQSRRQRNLDKLSNGRVSVLVATDVAARGIHVDDIDLVIQADAPDEYKTYLHRSGRTGRAGKAGTVVTLIPRQRRRRMTELLGRAEIEAAFEDVAAGDARISDLVAQADAADLVARTD